MTIHSNWRLPSSHDPSDLNRRPFGGPGPSGWEPELVKGTICNAEWLQIGTAVQILKLKL